MSFFRLQHRLGVRVLRGAPQWQIPSTALSRRKCVHLDHHNLSRPSLSPRRLGLAFGVATFLFSFLTYNVPLVHAETPSTHQNIRLSEVRKHGAKAERRWVVKGTKVYDITDWIPNHPGGEVILRAVGGVIDPYWEIFTIHKKKDVYDVLEQYYVGDLDPRDLVDGKVPSDDIEDPFKNDPRRDSHLLVHSDRPCNAETAPDDLKTFITPNSTFYVRNHLWVPQIGQQSHRLQIELPDGEEVEYSLDDLKSKVRPTLEICQLCSCC